MGVVVLLWNRLHKLLIYCSILLLAAKDMHKICVFFFFSFFNKKLKLVLLHYYPFEQLNLLCKN